MFSDVYQAGHDEFWLIWVRPVQQFSFRIRHPWTIGNRPIDAEEDVRYWTLLQLNSVDSLRSVTMRILSSVDQVNRVSHNNQGLISNGSASLS